MTSPVFMELKESAIKLVHHSYFEHAYYWIDDKGALQLAKDPSCFMLVDKTGQDHPALGLKDGLYLIETFATSDEQLDFAEKAMRIRDPKFDDRLDTPLKH